MDSKGNYTDHHGKPLTVGARVHVRRDYDGGEARGMGTVLALPGSGNDYEGFPTVKFDHDHKQRHVPDSALVLTGREFIELSGDDLAAFIERMNRNPEKIRTVRFDFRAGGVAYKVNEGGWSPTVGQAVIAE